MGEWWEMGSDGKQRNCILRWKATGGLQQKRRMSLSDLFFSRSILGMVSKGRSRETHQKTIAITRVSGDGLYLGGSSGDGEGV